MDNLPDFVTGRLPELLVMLNGTDVTVLELDHGNLRVRLHRIVVDSGVSVPMDDTFPDETLASGTRVVSVVAPLVGTFYRAGKPGMSPLVSTGTRVDAHTIVGIVEALQVLTEIEAGCAGVISEVLATDGQPVEYGQALFEVTVDD